MKSKTLFADNEKKNLETDEQIMHFPRRYYLFSYGILFIL